MQKKDYSTITDESGVYMIKSILNPNLIYIGSSKNLRKRYREHYNELRNKKHKNKKLQNYVNKYGINSLNFFVHIIEKDLNKIRVLEKEEIHKYNTYRKGFNLTDDTDVAQKAMWTEELKRKLSESARIRQSKPEVKERLKIQNTGENNPYCKLKDSDIDYIKENEIFNKKKTRLLNIKELSTRFNVNVKTIRRILKGETRKLKTFVIHE